MKRRISKFLKTKSTESFNHLDDLFMQYIHGDLLKSMKSMGYEDILFSSSVNFENLDKNFLQMDFTYSNFAGSIVFYNSRYEYIIYKIGTKGIVDSDFIKKLYNDSFSSKWLLEELIGIVGSNPEFTIKKKNKKIKKLYSVIAGICLCLPIIVLGIMAILVFGFDREIQLNGWFSLVFVIPWTIWFLLGIKYKKT